MICGSLVPPTKTSLGQPMPSPTWWRDCWDPIVNWSRIYPNQTINKSFKGRCRHHPKNQTMTERVAHRKSALAKCVSCEPKVRWELFSIKEAYTPDHYHDHVSMSIENCEM